MHELRENLKEYAPLILRLGLAITFFLFGYHKLSEPTQSTSEIQLLLDIGLGGASAINYYLGLTEIIIGLCLLLGWQIAYTAFAAAMLILIIFSSIIYKYGLNFDPFLFRDIGLFAAALALWALGPGPWSVDQNNNQAPSQPKNPAL